MANDFTSFLDYMDEFNKKRNQQTTLNTPAYKSAVMYQPKKTTFTAPKSNKTPFKQPEPVRLPELKTPEVKTPTTKTAQDYLNAATTTLASGFDQINQGLATTADFLLPDVITPKPIQQGIDFYKNRYDNTRQIATNANEKIGITGFANDAVLGVAGAIPQAGMALATAGTSLVPSGLQKVSAVAQQAPTWINTAKNIINTAATNPMFYASSASMLGNNYEDAIASGASDIEAIASAFIKTGINAGVEISGGIETLPNKLKTGNLSAIKEWVKSSLDEGKEEVVQSLVSNVMDKLTYNPDMPTFSMTEDAVINPATMAQEFALGAIAGGVLGGGQIGVNAAVNAVQTQKAKTEFEKLLDYIDSETTTQANMIKEMVTSEEITAEQGQALVEALESSEVQSIEQAEAAIQSILLNNQFANTGNMGLNTNMGVENGLPISQNQQWVDGSSTVGQGGGVSGLPTADVTGAINTGGVSGAGVYQNTFIADTPVGAIDVVASESYLPVQQEIINKYANKNIQIEFSSQQLTTDDGSRVIEGAYANGKIIVNGTLSPELQARIADHEYYHSIATKSSTEAIIQAGNYTAQEMEVVKAEYAAAYAPVYGKNIAKIREEMAADLYARGVGVELARDTNVATTEGVRYAVDDNALQNTEALGNLTPLTYKEYQNLTSNSNANYVHGYNSNLDSFINDAFTNPQSQNKTLYIGKIPQNVAQTIKNLSNSDVSNYSVVIRNGEINKIFNDHGSDLTEIPRGQIAVTPEILAKISEVISNPDKITIKKSTNDNKTVLDFEKRINGYAIATEVISDKRKTLRPITFYVINKKNPPTISNANSLAGNVQNESGTDSDTTIPQSNSDVKYSLDSTGRSLTQAQAEYFKDSKVRDAEGRLETVYHGTPNTFTEFNYNNIGLNGTAMGKGFYFVNNKDFASGYTTENGNIVEAYIDIKKPLSETKKTITKAKLRRYIDVLHKTKETRGDSGIVWDYGDINSDGYQGVLTEATNMTYEYNDNDVAMVNEILNVNGGNFIEDFTILKNTLGYDGIIQSQDANTIYIPFLPNQIKSTDNLNPTEDADIRYSLSSDQQSQLDTLAEEHKKRVEQIGKQPLNPQDKDKQIKAEGMKYSAAQREIRQGDSLEFVEGGLTEKELRKKIDRLNTNYKGKVVQTVDGETGTVQGTAFGNIRVAMEDGSVRSFKPEQIVENRIPYPTAKQIDNGFGNVTITDKDGSTRNIAPEGIPLRTTDTLPDNVTVVEDEVLSDKYIQFQLNNGLAMVQGNLDFDQGTADIVYYDKGKNFLSETDLRAITEDVATYLKGKDIKTVLNSRKDYILNTIQKELANSGLFADGNVLIEDYNDFEPKPVDIPYEGRVKRQPTSTVDRNGNFINPNRERNVDKAPEKTTTTEPAKFEPSKMPMMDATVAPTTEEALKAELRAQFGDETFENVGTQVFSLPEEVKASNPQKKKSFIEKAQDFSDDVARTMINSGHEVDKMAKAANDTLLTHQYNNIKQARQSTEYNVSGKQTDFKGREIGKSLVEIFQPAILKGEEYTQTFYTYLLHRHNIDRQKQNKPIFGKKYSAIESYAEYKAIENKYPEFVKMAEDVYAYNRNLMDWRVESRLASREDADKFTAMYPHYVPVFRKGQRNNYASDFYDTSTSKTIKKAKGGDDDIEPIHTAMARQTSQVIKAAKENTFGLHMLDLIQEGRVSIDSAKIAQIDGEVYDFEIDPFNPNRFEDMKNTFSFYKDGQKVVLDVNEDLHNALAIMRRSTDDYGKLENAFKSINNAYKKLITAWNPIFAVKNFVKDGWDSLFYTRDFARFSTNYSEAIKQMATNGEMWKQYRALGGFGASVYNYDTGFNENILNPPTGIKKGTKWASDKIEAANYFVEQLPRFTEFLAIVDKAGYKTDGKFSNDISYETLMDAMYGAADITTNFSRSGTKGKWLNATYIPFFNPSVQGFDKLIRTIKGEKGFKGYVNLAAKAALLNILPSLINELVYADDEDYQNLRDSDKDLNYLFKYGDNKWVKIPKGRITGTISAGALRISRALQGDPDAWDGYRDTIINNIAPVNPLTSNIAMQAYNTFIGNRTWWGGEIVPSWMQDAYAPKDQYDEGTSYFAKAVGKTLNFSPMKIDYLLESYGGVLADFILPAMTPTAENYPGVSSFVIDGIISNDIASDFYDFKTENYIKSKAASDYTAEEIARYSSINSFLNKQASAVSDINAEIREIQGSDLTDNEKREKVRELNAIADGIMENAMAVLPAYEQALIDAGTGDKDTDYLIANYETFGVDYALQTYNKSSYESQLAKGTDLETYYADLVNRKLSDLGEEQIETPRGTYDTIIPGAVGTEYNYSTEVLDKIAGAAVSPEDWAFIDDRIDAFDDKVAQLYAWGFDDYQVGRLTEEFVMGSTARAKMTAASDIGIDKDTYLQGYIFGYQTTGTKQQRNNQIAAYIEDLDLDAGQKAALYNWLEVSSGNGAYSSGGSSGGSGSGSSAQDNTFEALLDFIQKQSKSSIAQPQLGYGEGLASYSPSYSTTQSPATPTNFDTSALDYIIAAANRGR